MNELSESYWADLASNPHLFDIILAACTTRIFLARNDDEKAQHLPQENEGAEIGDAQAAAAPTINSSAVTPFRLDLSVDDAGHTVVVVPARAGMRSDPEPAPPDEPNVTDAGPDA